MFILSYAFSGSAQSCSSGLHNSLIAETSFSFISSLFSLIVVNSFSVSREPITKRGELKSDFRPGAFTKRCNTCNAHKLHNDVKKLINASGEKKKLIPCCMHINFHELLLTLVLRKARGAPVAQMVKFKHGFALIVSFFAIQLLHCVTKTIANMAVICVINCEKLRIQNICSRVSVTMDRAPPLL